MSHESKVHHFPRLLIGSSLIFWGWMVDLPMAGLAMAFVLEANHWVPWRWDFDSNTHVRAWNISVLVMLVTAVFLWMAGVQPDTVRKFISWMPMFLFPLVFTQCFGRSATMLMSTFSYFSRRKIMTDRLLGMAVKEKSLSFISVYFVILMLVSAMGVMANHTYYFVGLLFLSTWAVWSRREQTRSVKAMVAALLVVMILAAAGQWGISFAHQSLQKLGWSKEAHSGDSHWNRARTRIGQIGMIKQSAEIFWRLKVEQGYPPSLLKIACYNRYLPSGNWNYDPPEDISLIEDISGLNVIGNVSRLPDGKIDSSIDQPIFRTTGDLLVGDEARENLPRYLLRGAVKDRSGVPLPAKLHTVYASVQDLEKNSVGSIRVTPRHAVLNAQIRWGAETDTDGQPFEPEEDGTDADSQVPDTERQHLRQIVDQLGLSKMDFNTKCRTIQRYFAQNFSYTKDLAIGAFIDQMREKGQLGLRNGNTPLAQFLHQVKAGHCEYFATATTLLLRESGEKARYCVGYAVQEYHADQQEYVVRGVHGHAWCRGWDQGSGSWVDLDFTPGTWILGDAVKYDWRRAVSDFLIRMKEDFTIWRTQPENQNLVLSVLMLFVIVVAIWVGYRLWQTRSRVERKRRNTQYRKVKTPLTDLEPILEKHLGGRAESTTLASWLSAAHSSLPATLVDEMVHLHEKWRFGAQPMPESQRERFVVLCQEVKKSLRKSPRSRITQPSSHRES